jgi:hypothetical protein
MPIQVTKPATLSKPLPRMSKKERRKAKKIAIDLIEKEKHDRLMLDLHSMMPIEQVIMRNPL